MTNRKSSIAAFLQKYHLSHLLLTTIKMVPFLVVGYWWMPFNWIGAGTWIGYYYGREVAHVGAQIPQNRWYAGYNPANWSRDNHLDFWPVLALAIIQATIMSLL